jgi:hypothetical protein
MTRGCEEDRCSPLGAGMLLYPPPRYLWYGVEVSATNSIRRFVVAARSGGQILLPHFSFKPEKKMMTRTLHSFKS